MAAVQAGAERKLSPFEQEMARRRALAERGEASSSSPTSSKASPSPTGSNRVSELAARFNSKSPSTPTSESQVTPPKIASVSDAIRKFDKTPPSGGGSVKAPSSGNELAEKLKARRQATDGASSDNSAILSPASTTSPSAIRTPSSAASSALLARARARPSISPPSSGNTPSTILKNASAGAIEPVVKGSSPKGSTPVNEKSTGASPAEPVVKASSPKGSTPVNEKNDLQSKLNARRSIVDSQGTTTTVESLTELTSPKAEAKSIMTPSSVASKPTATPSPAIPARPSSSSVKISAGMKPRANNLDTPMAFTPISVATNVSLDQISISPASQGARTDTSSGGSVLESISMIKAETENEANQVVIMAAEGEKIMHAVPPEIEKGPLAPFPTRLEYFDNLVKTHASPAPMPKPSYRTDYDPAKYYELSTERSENRVWTIVFAYIMPLVLMTVVHILQATVDERVFVQLPTMALLDVFPATKTEPTGWSPTGIRATSGIERLTSPVMKASRTARGTEMRDGYVWIAAGPRFEPSWTAEPASHIQASGLALDDWGNIFFCPTHTPESDADVSLVAIDAHTGERRWVWSNPIVTGYFSSAPIEPPVIRAGSGTPLVLNDPATATLERRMPQIVYHATRTKAHALKSSDGSNIWSVPTGVAESEDWEANRMWGLTHIPHLDALIGATNDGWIFVLDRATGASLAEVKKLPCAAPRAQAEGSTVPGWDAFKQAFPEEFVMSADLGVRCVLSPFAISPGNNARLFVTGLAKDEQDGTSDGICDRAALYVVEVVDGEADSTFPYRIRFAQSVLIGSTIQDVGSPVASLNGGFVTIGDGSLQGIRIYHASNLSEIYAVGGLGEGVPSVSLAQDEGAGALYVKMDSGVTKLVFGTEEDPTPQVAWVQAFADLDLPSGLAIRPASPISIVGNGLALAVHVSTTDYPYSQHKNLPLTSGVAFLDRLTGAVRSYSVSNGETFSDISIGMDGSIFAVKHPIARARSVEAFSQFSTALHPLSNGIARFKPVNFLELSRDASCAALHRIHNSLQFQGGWLSSPPPGAEDASKEDARHVSALAWQAVVGFQIFATTAGAKTLPNFSTMQASIEQLAESVNHGVPLPMGLSPATAFSLLSSVMVPAETICNELSAL